MTSKRGAIRGRLLLSLGLSIFLLLGVAFYSSKPTKKSSVESVIPLPLDSQQRLVQADRAYPAAKEADEIGTGENEDYRKAVPEDFKIERVHPSGDPKWEERARVRKEFTHIEGLVGGLREQGLEGSALYEAVERRLAETSGQSAVELLERYRLLDQELAEADLDAMSPEDQFEYLHQARRHAFGDELANALFFEEEAFTRYKFKEKAILEDTKLTPEEQQERVTPLRNALQVELASRGTYVSFGDDRQREIESRLREKHGDSLDTMSPEERRAAMLGMYHEELPTEMVEEIEQLLVAKAQEKAQREAYQGDRETILSDTQLSSEEVRAELGELSDRYNTRHLGGPARP